MSRGWAAGVLVVMLALAIAPAAPGAAAPAPAPPSVDRVLVLSVPFLTWSDVDASVAPRLRSLLDRATVANLSLRVKRRTATLGEGYASIGAGTRAGAPDGVDGLALAPGPEGTAARLTSLADFRRANRQLRFGAELGALGAALKPAGVGAAVIANSDRGPDPRRPEDHGRQAVAALMTPDGTLAHGRLDPGLLAADDRAPFGVRLDAAAVLGAFEPAWHDRAVVLVEASDLVRADAYAATRPPAEGKAARRAALARTDGLVGQLLDRVDPAREAVLVVAPGIPAKLRLTVAAVAAPGQPGALLRTPTTGRSGFVTVTDIAPTVLALLGVAPPASMAGRPMAAGRSGGSAAERHRFLVEAEEEARFRDSLVTPVAVGFVGAQVALSLAAVRELGRGESRRRRHHPARPGLEVAALVLLAALPCTYLAGLFPFAGLGVGAWVSFVLGGAALLALTARRLAVPAGERAARAVASEVPGGDVLTSLGVVLAVVVAVIVGSAVTGSSLQLSTVFGDSPIVAGRFIGINNLTFAQLATAALLLATGLAGSLGGRRGALAGVVLLAAVLVVDGHPGWGADVGGALAAGPAFALVGWRLLGGRIGMRSILGALAVTAGALIAFALIDLARPPSSRSHLGRLLEQVQAEGFLPLTQVVERKLAANLSVLGGTPWTVMVPATLAFVAYLMYRSPSVLGELQRRFPPLSAALSGILVAAVLGFALNDSGIAVPGMMLGVLNPVLVYLSLRLA